MFKLTCPVNQSIGINKKNIKELSSKYQSRSIYQTAVEINFNDSIAVQKCGHILSDE